MLIESLQKAKSKGIHSYEVMINSFLYDPMFGVVKTQEDVSKLCAESTEDQIVTWSKYRRPNSSSSASSSSNNKGDDDGQGPKTVVVGLIDLPYKD